MRRTALSVAGLALAGGLALTGCSSSGSDGGNGNDAKPSKPAASAPAKGKMTEAQRQALLKAIDQSGMKPKGVTDDQLAAAGDQVCQGEAQGKKDPELIAGTQKQLKVDKQQATLFVAAAKGACAGATAPPAKQ